MEDARVILVMLRQPRRGDPNEMRTDPLWEFGSFGCTGCHHANLMNPAKITELHGARFGFAQNGPYGIKLVYLTPPVRTLHHGSFGEAKWSPAEMPLTYASALTLVNNLGYSDVPLMMSMLSGVRRNSPVARFASKFRARREPLPPPVSEQVIAVYERIRKGGSVARSYVDALPYLPPRVDGDRMATYHRLLRNSAIVDAVASATKDSKSSTPRATTGLVDSLLTRPTSSGGTRNGRTPPRLDPQLSGHKPG
jgi:hypothetical protein